MQRKTNICNYNDNKNRHGRARLEVGFTTSCAMSAYH